MPSPRANWHPVNKPHAVESAWAGPRSPRRSHMNARDWIAAYAEKLETEAPSTEEFKAILELAGEAAHSSERVAAPVACWLAAKAGIELEQAMMLAGEVGTGG